MTTLSGTGGTLKIAGTLVAKVLAWSAEGDGGGYLGQAQVASVNTFYIKHGSEFKLSLGLGNTYLTGKCMSISLVDRTLHFHIKRR